MATGSRVVKPTRRSPSPFQRFDPAPHFQIDLSVRFIYIRFVIDLE